MKKLICTFFIVTLLFSYAYAAPENNFEYIDYPGTHSVTEAENGYVFYLLDGSTIYLDEYGNETDDIVGVMGRNVFNFDAEKTYEHHLVESVETEEGRKDTYGVERIDKNYLYDNNNNLITTLVSTDYDVIEKQDYIAVMDMQGDIADRFLTIYAKADGSVLARLPVKAYKVCNTYQEDSLPQVVYWHPTKSGLFVFMNDNGLCGVADINGNVVIEPQYLRMQMCDYERELFTARNADGVIIIDKTGEVIKEIDAFSVDRADTPEGYVISYVARDIKGVSRPLDADFNELTFFDEKYTLVDIFGTSSIAVQYAADESRYDRKTGLMDYDGNIILPIEYIYPEDIGSNLIKAKKLDETNNYTIFDYDGNIWAEGYHYVTDVGDNGLIGVAKEGFEGYIDVFGNVKLELPYGFMVQGEFSEGKASVHDDTNPPWRTAGSTAYVNEEGEIVLKDPDQMWLNGRPFKNGLAFVANHMGKGGADAWLLIRYVADIPSDWAKADIKALNDNVLLPDDINDRYRDDITREEFCEVAASVIGHIMPNTLDWENNVFTDTDNHSVVSLHNAGIIDGVSETEFAPNDLITREQAAKILNAMWNYLEIELPEASDYSFNDDEAISAWARSGVYNMNAAKVMMGTGDNKFSPQDNYTREQAMVTMLRIFHAGSINQVVRFETDPTDDTKDTIAGFTADFSKDDAGEFATKGENINYLDNVHIRRSHEQGLVFGFSIYQRVLFQTEELHNLMWGVSTVKYDGTPLNDNAEKANEHIKVIINGQPVTITAVSQGKGSGHSDFYLHLDSDIIVKDICSICVNVK